MYHSWDGKDKIKIIKIDGSKQYFKKKLRIVMFGSVCQERALISIIENNWVSIFETNHILIYICIPLKMN